MNSNAPGQLLGYGLQLQRALMHLLQAESGHSVSVEVIGDVGIHKEDGVISEEDKSSISSNPVTNKSTDLWKTFSNWIESVKNGNLYIDKTSFILYSNYAGRPALVDVYSKADTIDEAKEAIDLSITTLNDIEESHEIYHHLTNVLSNADLFAKIIMKFEFVVGSKSSDEEIYKALIKIFVPKEHVRYMHDELLGWVTNFVYDKITAKEQAIITWDEFNKRFIPVFRKVRSRELIDFTISNRPSENELYSKLNEYPYYIQQLQIIDLDEDVQIAAVNDYLRSKINMSEWIEGDFIDEDTAASFEENLIHFWDNKKKRILIIYKGIEAVERGQLLHSECMTNSTRIANQDPPLSTITGHYHALADEERLGWHESWKEKLDPAKRKKK